jgi:Ca2+-binding EF-hand superfamily protein
MRKILFAAAGFAALAGAAGLAVAQDQQEQRPRGVFAMDANSDGAVTRQEFDAGRAASFAQLDSNNDGQLTREEMRAQRGERGQRRGGHRGMHHLASADANNDGNITREEFLARPNAMFDRMDANDDGVIAASERPQRDSPEAAYARRRPGQQAGCNFYSIAEALLPVLPRICDR